MNQEERRLYVDIERKISSVENVLKTLDDREREKLERQLKICLLYTSPSPRD